MHTPSFTIDSTSNKHIGLSWFINSSQGVRVLRHDGGDDGYASTLHFVPSQKFGFVILFNSDEANAYEIKTKVLNILLAFYTKKGKSEQK